MPVAGTTAKAQTSLNILPNGRIRNHPHDAWKTHPQALDVVPFYRFERGNINGPLVRVAFGCASSSAHDNKGAAGTWRNAGRATITRIF
jgi:hypothetical protein